CMRSPRVEKAGYGGQSYHYNATHDVPPLELRRAATVVLELGAAIGTAGCTAGADGATATADPACPAADAVVAGVAAPTAEVFPESISRFNRFRSARISDAT